MSVRIQRSRRIEAALDYDLGVARGWSMSVPLGLAYSYTHGQFLTSFSTSFPDWAPEVTAGDELPYLPEHQLGAMGGISSRRWGAYLNLAYVDAMRSSPGQGPIPEDESTGANLVLDLSLSYRLRDDLVIRLQARNVLDEVYVVARRPAGARPGRPRSLLIGLDWSF